RSKSVGCTGTSSTSSGSSSFRCSTSSDAMHTNHVLPKRLYYTIFGILMLCTYLTVQIAFFDLGPLNVVAALTIAVFKATLVVLFFMHVKYSTRLTWAVVAG